MIVSKPLTEAGRENYDSIFRKGSETFSKAVFNTSKEIKRPDGKVRKSEALKRAKTTVS
jgi:hypothetical protein